RAGVAGWCGGWVFWAWRLGMMAVGAPSLARRLQRWRRRVARVQSTGRARARPLWQRALVAAGIVGLVLMYLPILVPNNAGYDALWYHLPIAEQYVAQGRLSPFVEGWYYGVLPQLASLLYTWGFLIPL